MKHLLRAFAISAGLVILWLPAVSAQQPANQIVFHNFVGVYHLSRDARGLSLLTAEETLNADFPASGYTGITRSLPKTFQGHSVDIKIQNVEDASGSAVPFKTASDKSGNLVITTGDPAITLSGPQIIKINYQTRGVVNISRGGDEFLLNVNGRGWDQPFDSVEATLYVPNSFQAYLKGSATCYTALKGANANNCQVSTQKTSDGLKIATKTFNLPARQALVLKMNFAPATFTNARAFHMPLLGWLGLILLVLLATGWWLDRRSRKKTAE